jgi:hypothetical protein
MYEHLTDALQPVYATIMAISDANLLGRIQDKFKLMKKQYLERQQLITAAEVVVAAAA